MTQLRSSERILVTHVGSLPRPHDLLDLMKARLTGKPVDEAAYQARVAQAVADIVREQAANGVDLVGDGEVSRPGFTSYVRERLGGFEPRPGGTAQAVRARSTRSPSTTRPISAARCSAPRWCRSIRWRASGRSSTAATRPWRGILPT